MHRALREFALACGDQNPLINYKEKCRPGVGYRVFVLKVSEREEIFFTSAPEQGGILEMVFQDSSMKKSRGVSSHRS